MGRNRISGGHCVPTFHLFGEKFILQGGTSFPHDLSVVHIDFMNIVYQITLRTFNLKSISVFMMNNVVRKLWFLQNSNSLCNLSDIATHQKIFSNKKVEQRRRATQRGESKNDVSGHDFREELSFNW